MADDLIQKWNAGRLHLKANPSLLDASISKLSAAAQVPAKKLRDLMLSDEDDIAKMHAIGDAIKEGLSDAVKMELHAHKADVHKILGMTA